MRASLLLWVAAAAMALGPTASPAAAGHGYDVVYTVPSPRCNLVAIGVFDSSAALQSGVEEWDFYVGGEGTLCVAGEFASYCRMEGSIEGGFIPILPPWQCQLASIGGTGHSHPCTPTPVGGLCTSPDVHCCVRIHFGTLVGQAYMAAR